MKVLAITQARYGSTRLPAKILKVVKDKTLLEIHLRRILRAKHISKLMIATTNEEGVKYIIEVANKVGVDYHQGSIDDVLERFYTTAKDYVPDYVVRLTSDCPLIDPVVIDMVVDKCISSGVDYASNTLHPTFPDGVDVECMKFSALEKAYNEAKVASEREHVTPYIWKNSSVKGGNIFTSLSVENDIDYSTERITIDTADDFTVLSNIIENLGIEKSFVEYINYLHEHPEVRNININISRNEGYLKSINKDR